MSSLTVQEIQGSSSSGNKIQLASGHILHAPGHCIGFKTASTGSTVQTSSATFTDLTGQTLDYACKVASSIVYVIVHVHVFIPQQATAWQAAGIKILRGSTALYTDAGYGVGHYTDSGNDRFMKYISVTTATEPGDTSSHTYKVQGAKLQGSGNCDFNNTGYSGGGRITVMEIAQ